MTGKDKAKQSTSGDVPYIDALKRLDERAWEQLYTQIYGELYRFLRKKLCDRHEDAIEDYIQEAFFRAYVGIQSFNGRSDIKTWVVSIAQHVAFDALRSIERKRGALQEPVSVKTIAGLCHGKQAYDPERTASLHELQNKLARAVQDALPPKQCRVLLTAMQRELTEAEVADALKMKCGTASSYIAQAKRRLRHCRDRFSVFL